MEPKVELKCCVCNKRRANTLVLLPLPDWSNKYLCAPCADQLVNRINAIKEEAEASET
jgi:hypothetical protein